MILQIHKISEITNPPPLFFKGISPLSGLEIHLEHRLCHNFYISNQHKFYEYTHNCQIKSLIYE